MEKKELSTLPDLATFGQNDRVLAFSQAMGGFGFIPAGQLSQKGYACRRWNINESTPTGKAYGNLEYLRRLPELLGLGCYLVDANRIFKKLDPTNHHKFADGSPAALDGTMGDYMWCWNPHYYAWWTEGNYYYEAVSLTPISGKMNYFIPRGGISAVHGGVIDRENNRLVSVVSSAPRYRGGNNDAAKDNTPYTQLGMVATATNVNTYSSLARAKGEGWEAGWFTHVAVVGYLVRIIMGTRNVQAAYNANKDTDGLYQGGFGYGVCNAREWWRAADKFKEYPFLPTSAGVEAGDAVGLVPYTVMEGENALQTFQLPVFFGLKNFYGHVGTIEAGSLISKHADGGDFYVAKSWYDGYTHTVTDKMIKATTVPKHDPDGWRYITQLSMQNLCHAPTITGGTETTYYADGFYNNNAVSGFFVPLRRGHAHSGGYAGLECCLASNGVSIAHADWSSPLCVTEQDVKPIPFMAT